MQLRPVTWLDTNVHVERGGGNNLTLEDFLKTKLTWIAFFEKEFALEVLKWPIVSGKKSFFKSQKS